MRLLTLAALATTFVIAANGCAAADVSADDDDQGTAEQGLTQCTLGTACATLNVLGARAFDAPILNRTRTDVRATAAGNDVVPRILVQKTSRLLKFDGGRATLSGDAAGTAPLFFDDFVLIEILAVDGKALGVTVLGHEQQTVRVEGKTISAISPVAPWAGPNRGFAYDAGKIDLASLLPRDQPFRLRFTAFDTGGVGLVSDIHLRWSAAPPGGTSVDPFDPSSCTEREMTKQQALARFAPAARWANVSRDLHVAVRSRACHPVTGCAEWRQESSLPVAVYTSDERRGAVDEWHSFSTPLAPSAIDFEIDDNNQLVTWVFLNEGTGGKTIRWNDRMSSDADSYWTQGTLVVDGRYRMLTKPGSIAGNVGPSCTRMTLATSKDGRQYEMAIYAKY